MAARTQAIRTAQDVEWDHSAVVVVERPDISGRTARLHSTLEKYAGKTRPMPVALSLSDGIQIMR